jgi:hypothetical protein
MCLFHTQTSSYTSLNLFCSISREYACKRHVNLYLVD